MHIVIDNPKLLLPDGRQRLLGKRIRLVSVKGFEKSVQKICRYLEKKYSLQIIEKDVYQKSIFYLNISPSSYSSKLKLDIKRKMPTQRSQNF